MRVFRCITLQEINNLYKGKNENRRPIMGQNTFEYDKNQEYIHFFRYSDAAKYYSKESFMPMDHLNTYALYMIANIPNEILDTHFGYGIYNSNGIDVSVNGYIPLPEYAIPADLFQTEYIVEINNLISYEYSNTDEFKKYLKILNKLYKEYKDYNLVLKYLMQNNLQTLLNVQDDTRSEQEITNDKIKELDKVFRLENFL